ncbi:hypothetical protein TRFO_42060 [Tritrichomonas foetus]|uniref:Uncharacterized protein n=1 Tax=Tritrichomonas foetus TaxID=1144522 RepID=A0A1J4KY39_9EUKA|nr:hypothetical protein TRFO_42060 [Tritrichomonas foetus]|eukprot:OHT16082.1 hypothetical protein TRFO_42060 [Tritrichomonas foetus]
MTFSASPTPSLHSLRMTVDLIRKKSSNSHFGSFLFSFLTDSLLNITAKGLVLFGTVNSFIYVGCILIAGLSLAYLSTNFDPSTRRNLEIAAKLFQYTPEVYDDKDNILVFVPFYILLIITVICLLAYLAVYFHHIGRYKGTFFHNFFLYYSLNLSTPLFTYNMNLLISAFCHLIYTGDLMSIIIICLGLFNTPGLILSIVRAIIPLILENSPTANTSISHAVVFYICLTLGPVVNTIGYYVIDNWYSMLFLYVSLALIQLANLIYSIKRIIFTDAFSKVFTLLAYSSFVFFPLVGLYSHLGLPCNKFAFGIVLGIGVIACFVGSFFYVKHKISTITNEVSQYDNFEDFLEILKTKNEVDIINIFGYVSPSVATQTLATQEMIKYVIKEDYSLDTIVLAIRYLLASGKDSAFIYEIAIYTLTNYTTSLLVAIQLIAIIEMTSDSVYEKGKNNDLLKQRQIDFVLQTYYKHQLGFWRSVLHSSPDLILKYAYSLNSEIQNVKSYFKQIKVKAHTRDQYGLQYINFLINTAGDYEVLEKIIDFLEEESTNEDSSHLGSQKNYDLAHVLNSSITNKVQYTTLHSSKENHNLTELILPNHLTDDNHFVDDNHLTDDLINIDIDQNENSENISIVESNAIEFHISKKELLENTQKKIEISKAANRFKMPYQVFYKNLSLIIFLIAFLITFANIGISCGKGFKALLVRMKTKPFLYAQIRLFEKRTSALQLCVEYFLGEPGISQKEAQEIYDDLTEEILSIDTYMKNLALNLDILKNCLRQIQKYILFLFEIETEPVDLHEVTTAVINYSNEIIKFASTNSEVELIWKNDHQRICSSAMYAGLVIFAISLLLLILISQGRNRNFVKLAEQPLLIEKDKVSKLYEYFDKITIEKTLTTNQFSMIVLINFKLFFCFSLISIFHWFYLDMTNFIHSSIIDHDRNSYNHALVYPFVSAGQFLICDCEIANTSYDNLRDGFDTVVYGLNKFDIGQTLPANITIDIDKILASDSLHLNIPTIEKLDEISLFSIVKETSFIVSELTVLYMNNCTDIFTIALRTFINSFSAYQMLDNTYVDDFSFKSGLYVLIFVLLTLIYLLFEIVLFIYVLYVLSDIDEIVKIVCRLCTVLPEDSLFSKLENGKVNFWRERPESKQILILDALPIGVAHVDSYGNIVSWIHTIDNIGKISHIRNVYGIHDKYYSAKKYEGKSLPADEYGRKIECNKKYHYYIVKDETSKKKAEIKIQMLCTDAQLIHSLLIPSSIRAIQCDLLINSFIIIEVHLHLNFDNESFIFFKNQIMKLSERLSMILALIVKRHDIVAVFSGLTAKAKNRLYIRESYLLTQKISHILQNNAKIALVSGNGCLCEINDSKKEHFSLYSRSFLKSLTFLKTIDFGEIATEWSIMKAIGIGDKDVIRSGTVQSIDCSHEYVVLSSLH